MQRATPILAIVLSLIIIALVHFGYMYYREEGTDASCRVVVKIPPGASLRQVKDILVAEGLLNHPKLFRWAAYFSGREKDIKAGRYLFREGESVAHILHKLIQGEIEYARVVIPEGYMANEIAGLLQDEIEIDSTVFMQMVFDSAVIRDFGFAGAPSLEGYLYPDTYLFNWPLETFEVVERIVHRFKEIFTDSMCALADSVGFSMNEAVTLASIIQAEAVYDSEMRRISAVYHNRLRKGWRLEADPTVAFAKGGIRRKLWYKDLRVKSPYNTYRVRGLPPGPICSPGRAALSAAVQPLEGCRDLYFVADGTGRHYFSRTLSDHVRAKESIRAGRRPSKPMDRCVEKVQETKEITAE
ncbi:MAG: endolytic transglycosylase MltG [bacterium]|nr:MAG: endolytic transglycosylase MltG [bacterium]